MADDLRTIAERCLNPLDGGNRGLAMKLATFALAVLDANEDDSTPDEFQAAIDKAIERAGRE